VIKLCMTDLHLQRRRDSLLPTVADCRRQLSRVGVVDVNWPLCVGGSCQTMRRLLTDDMGPDDDVLLRLWSSESFDSKPLKHASEDIHEPLYERLHSGVRGQGLRRTLWVHVVYYDKKHFYLFENVIYPYVYWAYSWNSDSKPLTLVLTLKRRR